MDTNQNENWSHNLLRWFEINKKSYPWRETDDPYRILVSELMLQQTRIQTVLDKRYYENWLQRFPDTKSLAAAEEAQILKAWEGLGYYNRARNLQRAAMMIEQSFAGIFPSSLEQIESLPGVGPYTAAAVASFAFNQRAPIVDGNVIRVLSRVHRYDKPVDTSQGKKDINDLAELMTPPDQARDYNSAIMELGQVICINGSPRCGQCPVSEFCLSCDSPESSKLPKKSRTTKITRKKESVLLVVDSENRVFLEQEQGSRRNGLWRLPERNRIGSPEFELITEFTYAITRYQIELSVWKPVELIAMDQQGEWFSMNEELPPLGAPYLRAIKEYEISE